MHDIPKFDVHPSSMQVTHWLDIICPSCQTRNWINEGDPTDITGFSVDSFRCHSCKDVYDIDGYKINDNGECHDVGLPKPD